ncbi:MAG: hypothetical protein WBM24_20485 [Candidatus Sulfotelmatobacter sp.]
METVLMVYTIYASAVLIWSTSHGNNGVRAACTHPSSKSEIDYVSIPSFLLRDWIERSANLVVFDLHVDNGRNAGQESFPEMLSTSVSDLHNLLKWLPPESTVVFSCGDNIERFDAQIEEALLHLGIEAVYFLDKDATFKRPSGGKVPEPKVGEKQKESGC